MRLRIIYILTFAVLSLPLSACAVGENDEVKPEPAGRFEAPRAPGQKEGIPRKNGVPPGYIMITQRGGAGPHMGDPGDEWRDPGFLMESVPSDASEERGFKARLMIMMRLIDYLDLSDAVATKLFPLYNNYLMNRFELNGRMMFMAGDVMQKVEDESVPVAELRRQIEEIERLDREQRQLREDFLDEAEDMLEERQYIKLVLFDEKMKNDLVNHFVTMSRRYEGNQMENPGSERPENGYPGRNDRHELNPGGRD